MKKSSKIKLWAWIGAIGIWMARFFYGVWYNQYHEFESAGEMAQECAFAVIFFQLILTVSAVKIIGLFAELIEEKKG